MLVEALFARLADNERRLFAGVEAAPWLALASLGERLEAWLAEVGAAGRRVVGEDARIDGTICCDSLLVGPGAVVEPTAVLLDGPVVLGPGAVVRAGAYTRGPVFIGAGCVVGHASEIKNSILLAGAAAPHFAFVGDSILGHDCNLGAGTKLSNLRLDRRTVRVRWGGDWVDSGLRKLGALLGDGSQTGCNAVLNPGTVLMPDARVLPGCVVGGLVEAPEPRVSR